MITCSKCGAIRVPDDDISAYSYQHGADAAYHWAVGSHTQLNDGKPPCIDCGYQFKK